MTIEGFDIDAATADRLVAPAAPGFRTRSIASLSGGANSAVFEVRSDDGRSLVVKVYSDQLHWKMEKEVAVYERMRRHELDAPMPAILAADDSKSIVSKNVLVMTKVEGTPVASLAGELDERELVAINRQIGTLLAALHEIRFDEFGYVGTDGTVVDGHATNLDYMRSQFEKRLRELGERGGDEGLRRSIQRHVAQREELLVTPQSVFCHNDCHHGNVLVLPYEGGWRISGLVDFENVVAGDSLLDLAKTHAYARDHRSEATLAALAESHGRLRERWRDALDLYVLYHALELWAWFAYIGVREPLAGLSRDMSELVANAGSAGGR